MGGLSSETAEDPDEGQGGDTEEHARAFPRQQGKHTSSGIRRLWAWHQALGPGRDV